MIRYLIQWIVIMILVTPFYLWLRRPFHRVKKGRTDGGAGIRGAREIVLGTFVLFMISLLMLVFQGTYQAPRQMLHTAAERIQLREGVNLAPFRTISVHITMSGGVDAFLVNIVGNIVMFIPWGLGLPLLWKKNQNVGRVLIFSALLPLFIEAVQLFIDRSVDVDDFILNFLGGCLGGLLYSWGRRRLPAVDVLSL